MGGKKASLNPWKLALPASVGTATCPAEKKNMLVCFYCRRPVTVKTKCFEDNRVALSRICVIRGLSLSLSLSPPLALPPDGVPRMQK